MMKKIASCVVGLGISLGGIGVAAAHDGGWDRQSSWQERREDRREERREDRRVERLAERADRAAERMYAMARAEAAPYGRRGFGRYQRNDERAAALAEIARVATAADRLSRAAQRDGDQCSGEIAELVQAQRGAWRAVRMFGGGVRAAFDEVNASVDGLRSMYHQGW